MDTISRIVKSDQMIRDYGEKLCCRHGHDKDQFNYIRGKLREMGRLLQELRRIDASPNKSLKAFIDPACFRSMIEAVKCVASFDRSTNRYGTPSLALKIGHTLQKVAGILIGQGIERGDEEMRGKAESFLKLVEMNWTDEISSNALKTLYEGKKNSKTKLLPLTEDVKLMTQYLREEGAKKYEELVSMPAENQEELKICWYDLCKIVLAKTIMFNRRRVGGVSKMKMDDYKLINQPEVDGCIALSLSETERKLCRNYLRVEITSKKGRTVPVLFSPEVKLQMDLLVKTRPLVVIESNPYLFPRVFRCSLGHLRGSDCIRNLAVSSGAKEPSLLKSNNLRKQIATLSQILNLRDNELDILANFMGHDIRVHRDYYRLPESTLQVAKVSKLLLAMENGGEGLTAGKTLDSFDLDDEECAQESDAESESDSESETDNADDGEETDADDELETNESGQLRGLKRFQADT